MPLALVAGCADAPGARLFTAAPVDPTSSVGVEVDAASRAPGPYPKLSRIPAAPTDVRSADAWRGAVAAEMADKRNLDQAAAAIPFTLQGSEAFAEAQRAKISPAQATQAPADAEASAQTFADTERARAIPPPAPH